MIRVKNLYIIKIDSFKLNLATFIIKKMTVVYELVFLKGYLNQLYVEIRPLDRQ